MASVSLLLLMIVALSGLAAITWWSTLLWKRRNQLSPLLRAVLVVMGASAAFGVWGTVVGAVKVLGAAGGESIDPSQKARLLAEGISEAMNCSALGLVLSGPAAVVLLFMTRGGSK